MKREKTNIKLIAQNKKVYHEYFIEESFQAGIELFGTEVKSLRLGKCNVRESYIAIENREAFVVNMHISPYEQGNIFNKDPMRKRRLLLHKSEINKLLGATQRDGYTIVPTRVYLCGSLVKIDIAMAKGKKLYDKRHTDTERSQKREMEREFKGRRVDE